MCRILIVEDEDRIAAFMSRGLRKQGYRTAIAKDGIEAVAMGIAEEFDLMLLDLGLPGKDGWTVLSELQSQGKRPRVNIVVTARDDAQDRERGDQLQIDDYVVKPFRFQDLLERVKARLMGSSS
jgi:DNA-binding response OmpR family regulator